MEKIFVSFLYKNNSLMDDKPGNQLEIPAFKSQCKGNKLKPRRDIMAIWVLAHYMTTCAGQLHHFSVY